LLGHAFKVLDSALGKDQSYGSKVESESTTIAAIPLAVVPVVPLAIDGRRPLDITRGSSIGSRLLILLVVAVHAEPQQQRIAVPGLSRCLHDHRPTTCRAHLLSLQPAFETTKMQNVATGQLLGTRPLYLAWVGCIPGMHLFSANNTGVLAPELLGRRIRILVHVLEGLLIPE
jgi:hypothetical protein